jgi:hypothetical protein
LETEVKETQDCEREKIRRVIWGKENETLMKEHKEK